MLGGYDADKISGNNLTIPFSDDPNCPTRYLVNVTDIKMNLKNGSNPSLLGPSAGSTLRACIRPGFPHLSLPQATWTKFVEISKVQETGKSEGLNDGAMLILAQGAYVPSFSFCGNVHLIRVGTTGT